MKKNKILLFENDKRIDTVINVFSSEKTELISLDGLSFNKDFLISEYKNLRVGKPDYLKAVELMERPEVQAAMLLKLGFVDAVVGGCATSSKDILFPIIRILRDSTVSSVSVLLKDDNKMIFADTSISTSYTNYEGMVKNTIALAKNLGMEPSVALLSHSTNDSSSLPEAEKIKGYAKTLKEEKVVGPIQFDAAFKKEISIKKGIKYIANPNIFIFPNLDAANIGYKIAQQLGGWKAAGPIFVGIKKPFNDLSRGSTVEDILATIEITESQLEAMHE